MITEVNPDVKNEIKKPVLGTNDRWGTLGKVTKVVKEETAHTITSLSFFDRLKKAVLKETGEIRKCLDEYYESFLIGDELRKCLLMPEFKLYDTFSPADRKEFIFHVFKALCLGGKLCQYEDELEPYLYATKNIYKDLIAVSKAESGRLHVASLVYEITDIESSVSPLFPIRHPQNFCYVSIDPLRRQVNVFYHASDAYY
ncbi:hypothetical protein HDV01_003834 [Terramyces sp. JEL0728]|nr:hypothetical protein HDV01_003834 [Terramyces sp. JEL0728]